MLKGITEEDVALFEGIAMEIEDCIAEGKKFYLNLTGFSVKSDLWALKTYPEDITERCYNSMYYSAERTLEKIKEITYNFIADWGDRSRNNRDI